MWLMRVVTIVKLGGRNGLLLLYALRHAATPRSLKIGILAMLAYLVSPIDIIPEAVAGLFGLADDAALLMVGIPFLIKRLPEAVRADAQAWADALLRKFGLGSMAGADTPENTVEAEAVEPAEPKKS
jgi:uncharacterized membrane protein YkvA (DUF1232 family)